jgi:hypothetical protein
LRGGEESIPVELTGLPGEDLRDRAFEFEVPANDFPPTGKDRERVKAFKNRQIGAVGKMTTLHRPDAHEESSLYFEWFSQIGRVVMELQDVSLCFIENPHPRRLSDDDFERIANEVRDARSTNPEFTLPDEVDSAEPQLVDEDEDEDFALIPEELNQELERGARRIDLEIATGSEEAAQAIEECELLDDLLENGVGTPLTTLLQKLALPPPDSTLTELEAQQALTTALAELALHGIAVHACEHCSMNVAYRLLIEKICPEGTYFPEMRGTSYVQHFTTGDFCELCLTAP